MSGTNRTLKEYQYFLDAKSDKSPFTIKQYKIVLDKFIKEMNIESVQKLESLKANEIRSYIMGLNGCANSKNGTIRVLKLFYNWLWKNDLIVVNSMIKIDRMKVGKKVIKMPTNEEMEIIYSNCKNETTSLVIHLASRVGLRRSEICKIKITDIKENGRIKVNGKGSKERTLKLPENLFLQIKKYISHKNRKESEFLFSYDGHSVTPVSINIRVTEYINSLDFSKERKEVLRRVHGYRHRCATNVYNLTKDPYAVKHQMGHQDLNIGQIYIHAEENSYDDISGAL